MPDPPDYFTPAPEDPAWLTVLKWVGFALAWALAALGYLIVRSRR